MPKGRRVRRVVRKIDTWTVLRLSFVFWVCVGVITLGAGILLWGAARALDVFTSISKFLDSLGLQDFQFNGPVILKAAAFIAFVLVLLATGASVLLAVLYNLISDVVGGIEVVVLEEEITGRQPAPVPVAVRGDAVASQVGPAVAAPGAAVAGGAAARGEDPMPEVATG